MKISEFLSLIICFFIVSCSGHKETRLNFDKSIYTPSHTSNFKIEEDESSDKSMITVYNPWQGAENVSTQVLIIKEGEIPENFSGQIINGNIERIVCMSSTHVAIIEALGETDKIVGVSGKQYISNPSVRNNNKIRDVGYEGNMDYETLVALKPDLVLLFSINGASSLEAKLKEFHIPFMYVGDYVEENPLGKAEWIIPIAETLGIRDKGIQLFEGIRDRYIIQKDKVSQANLQRPKVMLNIPFGDSWFMPSVNSYVAQMVEDAGGDYVYKKNTGNSSMPIDTEEALTLVSEADLWLNTGTVKSLDELKIECPKFMTAKCVADGNVYNNNNLTSPGGGNDCYESGVVNPDLVLRDMIKIFHPELISEDFVYYHKLK